MSPADPGAHRKRKMGLVIALGVALFFILLVASLTETTRQQRVSVSVDHRAESLTSAQPPALPPLQIQSSGRLPQQIQGLRLGMTLAEALAVEPGLSGAKEDTANEGRFTGSTARGFSNSLFFKSGRLYSIEFSLANTSPEDTSALRNDVVAQLGSPRQDWDFPETTQLVWIDGDVRITYEDDVLNRPEDSSGRYPKLSLVDWPVYKQEISSEQPSEGFWKQNEFVKWGDEDVRFRPLPRELQLQGVQLGMLPSQMRASIGSGGLERSPSDTGYEVWKKSLPGNGTLEIALWHDHVAKIHEEFAPIGMDRITSMDSNQLLAEYGTPVYVNPLGSFAWTDGQVEIECGEYRETEALRGRWCSVKNLQLDRARRAEILGQRGPEYASVASPKSFF